MKTRFLRVIALVTLLGGIFSLMRSCNNNRGQPDITSWGQINQEVRRGDDWQWYVTDSPFQLGGPVQRTDEYGDSYTEMSYGSFSTTHFAYEQLIANESNYGGYLSSAEMSMDPTRRTDLLLATPPSE